MDEKTKKKLQKNIEIAEQELRKQYQPYGDKINKELANLWYEIMWSEKMLPTERKLSDEKLKKLRNLFIEVAEERRKELEEKKKKQNKPPETEISWEITEYSD